MAVPQRLLRQNKIALKKSLDKCFLEELGKITIEWAGLEIIIEITCAYLFKAALINNNQKHPPRPFKQRIRFIRNNLHHPLFIHIKHDFNKSLDSIDTLANKRNDIMHGAYLNQNGSSAQQIAIKIERINYRAEVPNMLTTDRLRNLTSEINLTFRKQFNLQDRMKCILNAYNGNIDMGRKGQIDE